MERLLVSLTVLAGLCAGSASHADAIRATWSGVVNAADSSDFPIAPGSTISGTFCLDSAAALPQPDLVDPVSYLFPPNSDPNGWESRIYITGHAYPSNPAAPQARSNYALVQLKDEYQEGSESEPIPEGTNTEDYFQFISIYSLSGGTEDDYDRVRLQMSIRSDYRLNDVTWVNGHSLVQSINWTSAKRAIVVYGRFLVENLGADPDSARELVDVDFDLTRLTYTPIPQVALGSDILEVPAVQVGQQVYKLVMRLVPDSNPLRFEIVDISESSLLPGPGNATFNPASNELHLPAVRLPDGRHVIARLRYLPETAFVELVSVNVTDCS